MWTPPPPPSLPLFSQDLFDKNRVGKFFFWEFSTFVLSDIKGSIGLHSEALQQSPPPPRTDVESPPVGQTLGSGESPDGRVRITKRPSKKKVPLRRTDARVCYFDETPLSLGGGTLLYSSAPTPRTFWWNFFGHKRSDIYPTRKKGWSGPNPGEKIATTFRTRIIFQGVIWEKKIHDVIWPKILPYIIWSKSFFRKNCQKKFCPPELFGPKILGAELTVVFHCGLRVRTAGEKFLKFKLEIKKSDINSRFHIQNFLW